MKGKGLTDFEDFTTEDNASKFNFEGEGDTFDGFEKAEKLDVDTYGLNLELMEDDGYSI